MNDPFQKLLDAMADQTISDEQFAQLEQQIGEDSELRKRFLDYQNLCGNLEEEALRDRGAWRELTLQAALETENSSEPLPSGSHLSLSSRGDAPRRSIWRKIRSAAVVLLVGFLVGAPLGWMLNQGASVEIQPGVETKDTYVATLIFISEDAVWGSGHGAVRMPGDGLDKGWMRLDAGFIELKFASGATVRVEGPAVFGVDSPLRGFLKSGTVSVHAPDEARDFVLGTATMEVVDLGTRFKMAIDQDTGKTEVEVIEGLVDLHLDGGGMSNRIQSLPAGRSALVNAEGDIDRIQGKPLDPNYDDRSGLLAHWKMDDIGDDGQITDASGNRLHGALNNNARESSLVSGVIGEAIDLGQNGYVDLSEHIPVLTSTASFTLAAWVCDAKDMLFSVSDGTPNDRIQFEINGKTLLYGWQNGDTFDHIRSRVTGWDRGRWYHIAVSVSGGKVTLYRDGRALSSPRSYGVAINAPARAPIDLDGPVHAYLGFLIANHERREQYLGGQIDDVQFYGRALDEQAIQFLFEHPGETYSDASEQRQMENNP